MSRVDRSAASGSAASAAFLRKALELRDAMLQALDQGRWNAAGLLGVHAAISASDALASTHGRAHSSGQSHDDAVPLLRGLGLPDGARRADQLREILS